MNRNVKKTLSAHFRANLRAAKSLTDMMPGNTWQHFVAYLITSYDDNQTFIEILLRHLADFQAQAQKKGAVQKNAPKKK
jgi:hypothetical protein